MSSNKSRFTRIAVLLSTLLTILAFTQLGSAQETRGTIRGTITDPNGQAVPNAKVQIIDPAHGAKTDLVTNSDGFYQAIYLIPGSYQIVVEATGFKKSIRDSVMLEIGAAIQINLALEVGGAQESVTVTADIPTLNTENGSLAQVVDQQRLAELPLVHGDPYTLIGMSNGTTFTGDPRLDRPFEPTHIVGYAINGSRGNRMDLTIDGVPTTATADSNQVIASYVPPSDIVQEFKVQTATFDAQFGNTEGSVTSILIKSGTNKLHGSAYGFLEPGQWAANDSFGKARGNPRPDTFSNRFGGYISGPVYIPKLYNGKDKSFFLFGYENIKDARPRFDITSPTWVPTAALAAGDFSAFMCPTGVTTGCTNIYDPMSRAANGTATQFADPTRATASNPSGLNIIPLNRIDSVAKAFMTYMGQPKNPGLVGNILDSTLLERTKPYYNWTFRVDQQITANNHMFVRGSWYKRAGLYNRYTDSAYDGQSFGFNSRSGVIDDVHTFNSTTFLNVKYGYNRFTRVQVSQPDAVGFDMTQLWGSQGGAYNNLIPEDVRRFPKLTFPTSGTGGTIGSGLPTNEVRPIGSHDFAAILNKTWGRHSFKFGSELRIYREDSVFAQSDQTGNFTFDNTYTRQTFGSSAGPQEFNGLQAFGAFLLGLPSSSQITRRADYSDYSKTWGFFVQDDFKVASRLTFNVGLRYEKEEPLTERQNKTVTGIDPNFVQPSQAAVRAKLTTSPVTGIDGITPIDPNSINLTGGLLFAGKDNHATYITPSRTFLPRFGAAYQLNDHTVIRGGIGLFAGFLGQRRSDVLQNGYTRTTTQPTTTLASGAQIPFNWDNFPSQINILEPIGNAAGKLTGLGGPVTFFNLHPKSPKHLRWQVGIQHELPWGFVADATYVGDYGYNIELVKDLNALPNQYLLESGPVTCVANSTIPMCVRSSALTTTTNITNPFRNVPGYEGTTLFTSSTIQRQVLLRPFPQFCNAAASCGVITTNNQGQSWYNSGQFSLQKRFSSGNTIQMSYTWSKWLQATEYLNPGDPAPTKMLSDLDAPHRFSATGIYKLPFGKGQKWVNDNTVLDEIIGGWQIQGVYQFQTGFPINFGSNADLRLGQDSGTTSGDIYYVGGDIGLPTSEQTTDRWFNTAAFSQIAPVTGHKRTLPFRFSDARRDNVNNVDMSLMKYFRITETMKAQFRLEAINVFNHTYFAAPSVTLGSSFGTIGLTNANQANYARRLQIGFKFLF